MVDQPPPPDTPAPRGISGAPQRLSNRRAVAVVGAQTFVGANLIGLLEESPRVSRIVSVDTGAPATASVKTRHYSIDLTSESALERLSETLSAEGVDTLVHSAFLDAPSHDPVWAHELESVGTMHVLNACRRARVRKVVMRSSTLLYGAHPTNPNFLKEHHALRARRNESYFADKIEAEAEAQHYGRPGRGRLLTILRSAPILGPTIQSPLSRYLSRRVVPTVMGFDPLLQFVHEADIVAAFKLAVDRDAPGIFNIVGQGVLPLSTVIKVTGRARVPIPRRAFDAGNGLLWMTRAADAPPSFLDYLQYLCVADGSAAEHSLGFKPLYTSREAVIDFASAQHLRDANLLTEVAG